MNFVVKTFFNRNIFASNLYVLSSDFGNLLIDPSFFDDEVKKYLDGIGGLDAILITHGHADHIRATDEFVKNFPNVKIYIHYLDADLLKDIGLNCSLRVGNEKIIINSACEKIEEGNLTIGGYDIQVFSFQGHTYGSVMYYFSEEKALFMGDTIMTDSIGTPDIPTGDANLLMKSVQKFKNLGIPIDTICYPGHGDFATYGKILERNPYIYF